MDEHSERNDERARKRETTGGGVSRRGFLGSVGGAGLGAAALSAWGTAGRAAQQVSPRTVAEFRPPNLPENIAIDSQGTIYVSMAPAGEIQRVNPDDGSTETVASFEVGDGLLLGITTDDDGTLYAAVNSSIQRTHGVWWVSPDGNKRQLAPLPVDSTQPNGITANALPGGDLLVTDHQRGAIWRVPSDGGEARVWVETPLFDPNPYAGTAVGVDGFGIGPDGDVWVDNLSYGSIVRVPVAGDGSAGEPSVFIQSDQLVGADGMTMDERGNLYVAVNAQNKVVRVTQQKDIETLVSGGGLDFPADVHFGTTAEEQRTLYIANFAYANFLAEGQTPSPSLMSIEVSGAAGTTQAGTTETERATQETTEVRTEVTTEQ